MVRKRSNRPRGWKSIEALKKPLGPVLTVIRDGRRRQVPASDLVLGEVVVLEAGSGVPADCRDHREHRSVFELGLLSNMLGITATVMVMLSLLLAI
jgi:hypothetical protein